MTPAPPFSDYIIRLLLSGPAAAGSPPRDAAMQSELRLVWGHHGERCGEAWTTHESWLRAEAVTRGIRPVWRGRFFGELLASTRRKGL
jgi:hypothetical protein